VIFNFCHLQIANPTVMEPRGLDFLRPIWEMMQTQNHRGHRNDEYIGLASDEVRVYYTKYVNNYKSQLNQLQPGQISIRDAVKDGLTPGKLVTKYSFFKKSFSRQCQRPCDGVGYNQQE
jgi:hypothetical protein